MIQPGRPNARHHPLGRFQESSDTSIRLGRLTLLVGPNAAGKSGVLQAIDTTWRTFLPHRVVIERDHLGLVRSGQPGFDLEINGADDSNKDGRWTLKWRIRVGEPGGPAGSFDFSGTDATGRGDLLGIAGPENLTRQAVQRSIGKVLRLRLSAQRLAAESALDSEHAQIDSEGFGLPSVIANLLLADRDRFDALEADLRAIVPAVKRIRIRRISRSVKPKGEAPFTKELADQLSLDMRSGDELPPQAISEGTLILLGLLTVLNAADSPRLLLIDDIDQALHPRAQADLIQLLRQALDRHPGLQVVATSHSPYLIDELRDDEVWVLNTRDDGTAVAACLADHPDGARFRGTLRTGEFLSAVGEDWVLGEETGDAAGTDR
ncbi:MAG TPA: AAA family ATPase [Lamprocystis sp. (in: g-proteobacteria)]|nr:AAA family ATPase [Lamprocystis sp. (in: g-proteobacteria)]